ncbi:MAG: ion channel [Bacteroidota bacterium]
MANKTEDKELGFGTKTSAQKTRLINLDGSFNIKRIEQSRWNSTSIYHALISMPWLKFNLIIFCYFIVINLIFAATYYIAGLEGLRGMEGETEIDKFLEAFFFSTQTVSTVGFGRLSPGSHSISIIAAIESLIGLLGFAIVTGLIYGRFSRPKARIIFSKKAIIAPFKDGTAFQFRIANKMRNSQISDIEARVTVAKLELENGVLIRRFRSLELEIKKIIFFPMTWTINHPIDENSPLYGMTAKDLLESDAEFMILLSGFDDTFSQTVSSRFSYTHEEVAYGAKFISVFGQNEAGQTTQDLNRISDYEIIK